ncbi:serine/threonine protein kinase [Candidatus Dojkabacteria bacterium]|uniref:Serine/threonine protein kinase n=1 Tax=Candidatus Dojkabacteria bacterium TaxID=2099670 RepID=A0A955RK41_9BACT|nr:serine/threonine protein kinase [Candidatus Dojkabacteria bacterium]
MVELNSIYKEIEEQSRHIETAIAALVSGEMNGEDLRFPATSSALEGLIGSDVKNAPIKLENAWFLSEPENRSWVNDEGEIPFSEGRYVVEGWGAKGAAGVVFKAWDRVRGDVVAIKVLSNTFLEALEIEPSEYLAEAQAVASLNHPHIVKIYDAFKGKVETDLVVDGSRRKKYESNTLLITEWAGIDLHVYLKQCNRKGVYPPIKRVRKLLREMSQAVDYVHQNDIVHRDIKPSNFLLSRNNGDDDIQVRLCDFGISSSVAPNGSYQIIGTPQYLDPVAITSGEYSDSSDNFAFAVTAFQLLFNVHPLKEEGVGLNSAGYYTGFMGLKEGDVMRANINRRTDLSDEAKATIEKIFLNALSLDKDRRYSTNQKLVDELEDALKLGAEVTLADIAE